VHAYWGGSRESFDSDPGPPQTERFSGFCSGSRIVDVPPPICGLRSAGRRISENQHDLDDRSHESRRVVKLDSSDSANSTFDLTMYSAASKAPPMNEEGKIKNQWVVTHDNHTLVCFHSKGI
jgi:hypothetical protein